MLNTTPDLIFNKDYLHHDGEYIECNRAFEAFVGKDHEEIIGNFFHTKDREILQKMT